MIKKFIFVLQKTRLNFLLSRKLKSLVYGKKRPAASQPQFLKYKKYWKEKGLNANASYYTLYSSVSNNLDPKYIPENLYYNYFEPALNNKSMLKAYSNKNLYQHIYSDKKLFPKIFIRSINGTIYTSEYEICFDIDNLINTIKPEKFILKVALDSGGGRGVELFIRKGNKYVSNNNFTFDHTKLFSRFGYDFVIQEYIEQHNFFKCFNESSVNSIRVFTYRSVKDEQIHILHSVLRIGQPGSIVDNQASGGLSAGVLNKKLNAFAINKKGERFYKAGSYNFADKAEIPFYDEIIQIAKKIALENHYARILGLDFCVDSNNKIRLLEVNNSNNEINFYQMNNGPLFGQFTDEIIDWCLTHPKTICLDFSV